VKRLRVLLLLCLALLLPLRGAWAVSSACPFMTAGSTAGAGRPAVAVVHPTGCPGASHVGASAAAVTHDAGGGHCVLCDATAPASVTCAPPALDGAPGAVDDVAFLAWSVRVERFADPGPERPPKRG
jgi:hypothetical protein